MAGETSSGTSGGEVDRLYIDIQARVDGVEQSLRQIEQEAEETGNRAGSKLSGALKTGAGLAAAGAVAVGGLLAGAVPAMQELAAEADKARASQEMFLKTLERTGTPAAEAQAAVAELSDKLKVAPEVLQEGITLILRSGGSLEDATKGLLAAGASAAAAGQDIGHAIENASVGLAMGRSEMMEYAGIVVNASDAHKAYAKELGISVDKMTEAQKITAYSNAVYKESAMEVADLDVVMSGLVGQQAQAAMGAAEFRKVLGEAVVPIMKEMGVVTGMVQQGILGFVRSLDPEDIKAFASSISRTASVVVDGLGAAFKVAGPIVNTVVDTIADTVNGLAKGIADAMVSIKGSVGGAGSSFGGFKSSAQDLQKTANAVFTSVQGVINNVLIPSVKIMAPTMMQAGAAMMPVLKSLGSAFQATFTLVQTLWQTVLKPVFVAIQPLVSAVFTGVGHVLKGALDTITNVFSAVAKLLRGDASGAWTDMKKAAISALQGLANGIGTVGSTILAEGGKLAGKLLEGFKNNLVGLKDLVVNAIKNAISSGLGGIGGWIASHLGGGTGGGGIGVGGGGILPNFQTTLNNLGVGRYAVNQGYGANAGRLNYGPGGHNGVDVATPTGTKLYAPTAATVSVGTDRWLGRYVKLVDANGTEVRLGHLSAFSQELVNAINKAGGSINVAKNTFLGLTGGAVTDPGRGNSTGAHLHIGVYRNGRTVDPRAWLNANGVGMGGGGIDFGTVAVTNTLGVTDRKTNPGLFGATIDPQVLHQNEQTYAESQRRMAEINRAAREGRIADARLAEQEIQALRDQTLARVEGNAAEEAAVEKKYAVQTRDAKATIAHAERAARDADIKNDDKLTATQRKDALVRSERQLNTELLSIRNDYDAAIKSADEKLSGEKAKNDARQLEISRMATDAEIDLSKARADSVLAEYERQKKGVGDTLAEQLQFEIGWQDTVIAARSQAAQAEARERILNLERQRNTEANKEGTSLEQRRQIWAVYAGKIAQEEQNLAATLEGIVVDSGQRIADLTKQQLAEIRKASAAQSSATSKAFLTEAENMLRTGSTLPETLAYLRQGLEHLYAVEEAGGDAAAGIADLNQQIIDLEGALAKLDPVLASVVQNGGVIFQNLEEVKIPELKLDTSWEDFLLKLSDDAAIQSFKDTLADLSDSELAALLSAVASSGAEASEKIQAYNLILAEQSSRQDEATKNSEALTESSLRLQEAQAQLAGAVDQSKRPFADQILALENLRGKPGVIAADLDRLIAAWRQLQAETEKQNQLEATINRWSDYAKQILLVIGGALEALGGMSEETAGKWSQSLTSMTQDITTFALALAKGDYLGAAVQGLTTIFNWFNRNKRAAQEAAKATADYNAQFKFSDDGYGTRTVTKSSTGFLFWQTTEYKASINEAKKQLALNLENGFVNGIQNGFKEALKANDFGLFSKSLRQSVGEAVLEGLIDAFMNDAILKPIIGPAIQEYMRTGDVGVLERAVDDATGASEGLYRDLKVIRDRLGLGSDVAGTGSNNQALFGNAPSIQLGIPRFEVQLPPVLLEGATAFAASVPIFDQASRRMLAAADMILASRVPDGPPPLSRNGGLT